MKKITAFLALTAFVLTLNGCPATGSQSKGGANSLNVNNNSAAKSAAKRLAASNALKNDTALLNAQKSLKKNAQKNAQKNFSGAKRNSTKAMKKAHMKQKRHRKPGKIKKKQVLRD